MVKFSKNWNNKLDNVVFSTIRKWSLEKEQFYRKNMGYYYNVYLNTKKYCEAKIIDVQVYAYKNVPFELLALDTGIPSQTVIDRVFSGFGIDKDSRVLVILMAKKGVS